MTTLDLALVAAVLLASAALCYVIARRRGSPVRTAFVTGLLLGPIGVLLVLIDKPTEPVRWQ